MCGLTGYSGKKKFNKNNIETLMLWNSLERGKDSTGIYTPKGGLLKTTDEAYKFLMKNPLQEDKLLIAHVRAKTVGGATEKNAHPFIENDVVLAHNGTLSNHWALCRKYGLSNAQYDVDSHVIAAIIGKTQNFDVIKEIDGGAAFLISNAKNPSVLYAFRNAFRPLFRGVLDKDMYISSIKESLEYIGCSNIQEFKEDTIYTIKDGVIISTQKVKNTPHKWANNTNNHQGFVPVVDLENQWLKCNRTIYAFFNKPASLKHGQFYYIEDTDPNTASVKVIDDEDREVWIAKYCFDFEETMLKKGCLVTCLTQLVQTDKRENVIFDKDEVTEVQGYYPAHNTVVLKSAKDGETYTIATKFIRRLTKREEDLWIMENLKNESEGNNLPSCIVPVNNQLPFVFSEHEMGIEHITEEFERTSDIFTNGPNDLEEDDVEDPKDEDDEDDHFDLMLNNQELCEAFNELDGISENLLEFNKYIPKEHYNDYMLLINALQGKLMQMEEDFTLSLEDLVKQEVEKVEDERIASIG